MKKFSLIYSMLAGILIFASCTKEISVNVNDADSKLVVEGGIKTGEHAYIRLSKSIILSSEDFPAVTGAQIVLSDNAGNTEILTETSPGIYESLTITGITGRTYSIQITAEGSTYSANSTIPEFVQLDSIMVLAEEDLFISDTDPDSINYQVVVQFNDPVTTNYYRSIKYINDSITDTYIFNDQLFNGTSVTRNLGGDDENLKSGDTLIVEFQCVDKSVYDYFSSFNGYTSSAPSNPYSNISGGALGYFNACNSSTKQYIVP